MSEALSRTARLLPLVGLVALSLVAQGWGIWSDLPYAPDVDEPLFIRAAVQVASGQLNPGWFGNPGSTVIYPIALLIRLWYGITDPTTLAHIAAPNLAATLVTDPAPFYLIGRLVSSAYGVGAVIMTWVIARRLANDLVAALAALVLPATSIAVAYGQLVRTDTAGMFFALVSLLLIIRAIEKAEARPWLVAGAAIGVAMSTRYFLVALFGPYLVGAALSPWIRSLWADQDRRRLRNVVVGGLVAAGVAFFLTSPFVLIDLRQTVHDLRFEARAVAPGADGLSPLGNLAFYFGEALPAAVGLALLVGAAVGLIVLWRRSRAATLVLAAFTLSYSVGVSLSPLHWDRYVIPIVPIVAILAALALVTAAQGLSRIGEPRAGPGEPTRAGSEPVPRVSARRNVAAAVLAAVAAVVVLGPMAQGVASRDRLRALPSTRVAATDWAKANIASGSLVCEEMYTTYEPPELELYRVFALANESLGAYRARGCDYLISSTSMSDRFVDAQRYPKEAAFYIALAALGPPVQTFEPGPDRPGAKISVYVLSTSR